MSIQKNAFGFKALMFSIFITLFAGSPLKAQLVTQANFTGIIVPKFMASGTSTRLPMVFRAKISGLLANSTYRYYVQGTTNSSLNGANADFGTSNSGAGNALLISQDGSNFTITTSPGLSTTGAYETFTTDANGCYTGWFGLMNTGATRFTAGNEIYPTLTLNNGSGGSTPALRFALDVSVKTLALNTSASATSATGIWGISSASSKNIIALYDNINSTGRPLSVTYAENENSAPASTPSFYSTNVNAVNGAWGALIPNINSNGLRKIEQYSVANGNFVGCASDADGIWPTGNINTVNPTGGTTAIRINSADAPLNTNCGNSTSGLSDIYATPAFAYPQNIAYINYLENALKVASFDVRDGGGAFDADQSATELSKLHIKVNYPQSINSGAIYFGNTKLADAVIVDSLLKFENLNFSVADNSSSSLELYVTFSNTVADNSQLVFTTSYAEASVSGSGFYNSSAGAASSSTFNDNNRIEVTATKLVFSVDAPGNATVYTKLSSSPAVISKDENGNTDIDFAYMVSLGNTSGLDMVYNTQNAVNGIAEFTQFQFGDAGSTSIIARSGGLTDANSNIEIEITDGMRWTGNAGNNNWNDSRNWSSNAVPSLNDIVILDNSTINSSFNVVLPDTATFVKYLRIEPSEENIITLTLSATNTACPGFTVGDNDATTEDLVLENGAIFINSGGCPTTPGLVFNTGSTFKVNNGGTYIHRNNKSHVEILDAATFQPNSNSIFDISTPTSVAISLANRTFGNLTLSAAAKAGTQAYSSNFANAANIKGNLTIESSATLSLSGNGYVYLGGNFLNNGSFNTGTGSRRLVMNGAQAQAFSGTGTYTIKSLEVNNASAEGITLNVPITLSNSSGGGLTLTKGLLNTSASAALTLEDLTTINGGSKESFVNGPVRKLVKTLTQTNVILPLGKDTFYRPAILKPQTITSSAVFTAEYFNTAPNNTDQKAATLDAISGVEYWSINQVSGNINAQIALSFGSSSYVNDISTLRVAKWDGTNWLNEGQESSSGSTAFGNVTSSPQSTYGMYTIGSTSGNPLPVTWLGFSAETADNNVILNWQTACELNNSGFEIQKSFDGINWQIIGWVNGNGTSQQMHAYVFTDGNTLATPQTLYYRLKQIDFNGDHDHSKVVTVRQSASAQQNMYIYAGAQKNLQVKWNEKQFAAVNLEIMNAAGQPVHSENIKGKTNTYIPMVKNASGVYVLIIKDLNGKAQVQKFVLP